MLLPNGFYDIHQAISNTIYAEPLKNQNLTLDLFLRIYLVCSIPNAAFHGFVLHLFEQFIVFNVESVPNP